MRQRRISDRGFVIYDEFEDRYGACVRVVESSLATESCVWVFVDGGSASPNDGSIHLTIEQAQRLRDALDDFIDGRGSRADTVGMMPYPRWQLFVRFIGIWLTGSGLGMAIGGSHSIFRIAVILSLAGNVLVALSAVIDPRFWTKLPSAAPRPAQRREQAS